MTINNPNRVIRQKEEPFFGQDVDHYMFLRVGEVSSVDNENNEVSIVWLDEFGGRESVDISSSYASSRSFLGAMPEVGAVVLCGFSRQTQTTGKAQILAYLSDSYKDSLRFFLQRGNYKSSENFILKGDLNNTNIDSYVNQKIGHTVQRRKRKKIYPGEIYGESNSGSEVYLSEDLLLTNSRLNEIELRSSDQNIISNSLTNTVITGASKLVNGLITRNLKSDNTSIKYDDDLNDSNLVPFGQFITLPNGKRMFTVTTDGKSLDGADSTSTNQSGGGAFNEFRLELKETSNGELNVVEENSETDIDSFSNNPFATFLLGTNVGNDSTDRTTYGKVLRPVIFESEDSTTLSLKDEVITNDSYRFKSLATAFELKFGNTGPISKETEEKKFVNTTKFSIDKQGHMFVNLSSSTSDHPLGAGRSLEMNTEGSIKLVVGRNAKGESLIFDTKGSLKTSFGTDSSGKSLDLTLSNSMTINVGADDEGQSLSSSYLGNVNERIVGNKQENIDGSFILTTTGSINEQVRGNKIESYTGHRLANYGGDFISNIIGKQESNVNESNSLSIVGDIINANNTVNSLHIVSGTNEETILTGNKKIDLTLGNFEKNLLSGNDLLSIGSGNKTVDIATGNSIENITVGNKELSIVTGNRQISINSGNSSETIDAGNKTINLTVGDYELEIGTGDIKVNTSIGSVTISGSKDVSISGLNVVSEANVQNKISAGGIALIDAPTIQLGGSDAIQPVVKGFELLAYLSTHYHVHPFGPTGPPIIPPGTSLLSNVAFVK